MTSGGPLPLPEPVDLGDLLAPFASRGVDLNLARLEAALAEGGNPERGFLAVQVAGTNGKGSICTQLHAILRAAGLRCAVYRSPHLVSWCERIQLDDAWIRPEQLRADLERWRGIGERHGLTPFELLTAAAFDRFAHEAPDVVVLEVGLGGRLDATTAHPQRPVIGFGSIGLDHREHLGPDLASIAAEKAGVMAAGSVAFSAAQEPQAAAVLEREAARRGCRLQWLPPLQARADGGPALGLAGDLQRHNAAVAVAMARALAAHHWPAGAAPLSEAAIAAGLAAARWPGRLERRHLGGRPLLLDGAHNPPAAAALRAELKRLAPGGCRWLLGIQRHKQAAEMLPLLLRPQERAAIVPIPGHTSWSAAELEAACPVLAGRLTALATPAAGLAWLMAEAGASAGADAGVGADAAVEPAGPMPVVAGSLHLLGEVIPLLDPPQESREGH